jgi:hypothetical protein
MSVGKKLGSEKGRIIRSIFGWVVGVEKKSNFDDAVKKAFECGVSKRTLQSIGSFMEKPKGKELAIAFYLCINGKKFRALQAKYKHMSLADWITLNEYTPSTCKYKFFRKPTHVINTTNRVIGTTSARKPF